MSEWIVAGSNTISGIDQKQLFEAATAEEAEAAARRAGILATSIEPYDESGILEALDEAVPKPTAADTDALAAALNRGSAGVLAYRSRALASKGSHRPYNGIVLGGLLLRLLAWICFIAAAVAVMCAVAMFVVAVTSHIGGRELGTALFAVMIALAATAIGLLFLWLESIGYAIRDIAQNSFRN